MVGIISNVNLKNLSLIENQIEIEYLEPQLLDSVDLKEHSIWENADDFLVYFDLNFGILKNGIFSSAEKELAISWISSKLKILGEIAKNHSSKNFILCNTAYFDTAIDSDIAWNSDSHKFLEEESNRLILALSNENSNVKILNWSKIAFSLGKNSIYDSKYWYLARMPLTQQALKKLWLKFLKIKISLKFGPKKVLCLDLDNTIWRGLAGEEGVQVGISEDGMDKIFRDFQLQIKQLKSLGVLLAIVSKNNQKDVFNIFEKNAQMILSLDDFVSIKVNWDPKPQNIRSISKELSLGLDSFVFIDDSSFERGIMRKECPEVWVPEPPKNIEDLSEWFLNDVVGEFFTMISLTEEDKVRSQLYKKRQQINLDFSSNGSGDFIKDLKIIVRLSVNNTNHVKRNSQLSQKTNQFNLLNKRWSEAEISKFIKEDSKLVIDAFYEDKYGSEGQIACLIFDKKTMQVEEFVMSCRVIGRGIESCLLIPVIDFAKEHLHSKIFGSVIKTERNLPAQNFFTKLDFNLENGMFQIDPNVLESKIKSLTKDFQIEFK